MDHLFQKTKLSNSDKLPIVFYYKKNRDEDQLTLFYLNRIVNNLPSNYIGTIEINENEKSKLVLNSNGKKEIYNGPIIEEFLIIFSLKKL